MLAEAERIVRDDWQLPTMRMTVIDIRDELIAFYERRGYARTGIKKPFPYGDARFGMPQRDDLRFEVLEKALVMSDWVRVCATSELLPGESKVAWDGDTPIVVFNYDGDFYALEDRCTHEDFELSAGPVRRRRGDGRMRAARFEVRRARRPRAQRARLCAGAQVPGEGRRRRGLDPRRPRLSSARCNGEPDHQHLAAAVEHEARRAPSCPSSSAVSPCARADSPESSAKRAWPASRCTAHVLPGSTNTTIGPDQRPVPQLRVDRVATPHQVEVLGRAVDAVRR